MWHQILHWFSFGKFAGFICLVFGWFSKYVVGDSRILFFRGEYKPIQDANRENDFSFSEKLFYFHRFLNDFPFSIHVADLMPPLGMVLNRVPELWGEQIFIDIGAHAGSVTTAFVDATRHGVFTSARVFSGKEGAWRKRRLAGVIAVEASSKVFSLLEKQAQRRWPPVEKLPRVLLPLVVCGPDGPPVMEIMIPGNQSASVMASVVRDKFVDNSSGHFRTEWNIEVESVHTSTVADIFLSSAPLLGLPDENFGNSVFLLKIDAEGYDHHVLRGAVPILPDKVLFVIYEQTMDTPDGVVPPRDTLQLLWDNGFGCFVVTGYGFVPVSDRWLSLDVHESLVLHQRDIFCGNLKYPDLLHHAIEVMSLYALPAHATSFDFRQREFVHDAIEDYILHRFGIDYLDERHKVFKAELAQSYSRNTQNGNDKSAVAEFSRVMANYMIGDSPEYWDQTAALYHYELSGCVDGGFAIPQSIVDAAVLRVYGCSELRNRSAAWNILQSTNVNNNVRTARSLQEAIRQAR